VSNPDSFIDEVTEEVRRDRLFAMFRRYGWIGGVLVLAIVAGAAYTEWRRLSGESSAQIFGDAVTDALDLGAPDERREALQAISAAGGQVAIRQLMLASDPQHDKAGAIAALDQLIADGSQPQLYRDLATLRKVLIVGADLSIADRRALLEPLSAPGRAFRPLALEQLAYLQLEDGQGEAAIKALTSLTDDQQSPRGLRSRASQAIIVLGAALPSKPGAAGAGPDVEINAQSPDAAK
jgi:hypothetical protein